MGGGRGRIYHMEGKNLRSQGYGVIWEKALSCKPHTCSLQVHQHPLHECLPLTSLTAGYFFLASLESKLRSPRNVWTSCFTTGPPPPGPPPRELVARPAISPVRRQKHSLEVYKTRSLATPSPKVFIRIRAHHINI